MIPCIVLELPSWSSAPGLYDPLYETTFCACLSFGSASWLRQGFASLHKKTTKTNLQDSCSEELYHRFPMRHTFVEAKRISFLSMKEIFGSTWRTPQHLRFSASQPQSKAGIEVPSPLNHKKLRDIVLILFPLARIAK